MYAGELLTAPSYIGFQPIAAATPPSVVAGGPLTTEDPDFVIESVFIRAVPMSVESAAPATAVGGPPLVDANPVSLPPQVLVW